LFKPREAFPEMAAVSVSDNEKWQSICSLLPMSGDIFGFKIGPEDWVFSGISADAQLPS